MSTSATHQGIIVAVDGSTAAKAAVGWAARDAALRDLPLALVHVLPSPTIGMWPEPPVTDDTWAWQEQQGHQILTEAREVVDAAIRDLGPVTVAQESFTGKIVPTLVDLSKDAAMIVVGCRGQSALERRLLGSVSFGLVHHAHCPVAVIHVEDPLSERPADAPVLVGIDGSPASERATAIAFEEASRRRVGVIAMHSWADSGPYRIPTVDWEHQLEVGKEALAERLAGWQERYPDVSVDRRLVYGDPAAQLIDASESAQLAVIGSHGRGGFAGMLLGSVSSAVVQTARIPVIVARQP